VVLEAYLAVPEATTETLVALVVAVELVNTATT
jgi:hypothetical protein